MTFLALPTWVALSLLLAAGAAAIAAFLIPPRRPRYEVPSMLVWTPVIEAREGASLWQRVRWLVSLSLAVIIAVATGVALTQPVRGGAGDLQRRVLIVLDSSWSMQARTPDGSTRWTRATHLAHDLVEDAAGREIAIATTADGIVEGPTRDVARVQHAIDRLSPSGARDGVWPRLADTGDVHFMTDGAVARVSDPGVVVHSVFTPVANVALTAFDVAPVPTDGTRAKAYVAAANFSKARQSVHLTVTRGAAVVASQSVEIDAGETYRDVLAVSAAGDARFRAHVSAADNALDIDDDAAAWLWTAQPMRVTVVGTDSVVPKLLAADPTLTVSTVAPAGYANATADVWVFDRWLPPVAPSSPALMAAPPASSWLGAIAREEDSPHWRAGDTHELLEGVDPDFVRLRHVSAIGRPSLRPVAVSDTGTPLVSVEEGAAGRYVVLGFSTDDSNIAMTSAFPVLLGNAIDWLGRPERGSHVPIGSVALPRAVRQVIAPNGRVLPMASVGDHATTTLASPGLYLIETPGASRVITVGLDDPTRSNLEESRLTPAAPGAPFSTRAPWPIATWGAWAALVLVAVEWLTWLRRVTV